MSNIGSRIKKDDKVKILAGKDKGKIGKVLKVNKKTGKVVVENINIVKVHTKPSMANQQGGIVDKEAPLNISNVMLMCDKCDTPTPTRVRIKKIEDGKKVRICVKCNETVA